MALKPQQFVVGSKQLVCNFVLAILVNIERTNINNETRDAFFQ